MDGWWIPWVIALAVAGLFCGGYWLGWRMRGEQESIDRTRGERWLEVHVPQVAGERSGPLGRVPGTRRGMARCNACPWHSDLLPAADAADQLVAHHKARHP